MVVGLCLIILSSDITGFCLLGTALDVVVFMIKLFLHYENAFFFYYAHFIHWSLIHTVNIPTTNRQINAGE